VEELLMEISKGIITLQRKLDENADLLDHESNLFVSNIIQSVNLTVLKTIHSKLNLAEKDRNETFFTYTKDTSNLGHAFIELLLDNSCRVLNNKLPIILSRNKANMAIRNILRAIEIRITNVGPSKDYTQLGLLYLNAGHILGTLQKYPDAIRFTNAGLIIFEDLDSLLKKSQISHSEVSQALIDNIFLESYFKGDLVRDIDGSVGVKVRVG
jgi:hypothetical protein